MKITFYNNNLENIVVDKTRGLLNPLIINGTLKNNCNIINPIIMIDITSISLFNYNYAYIEEFRRYYFIDNIEYGINNLLIITFKLDVLMSYKNGIKKLSAYISRNQNEYNDYIEDKNVDYVFFKNVDMIFNIFNYEFMFTPYIDSLDKKRNIIVNTISDNPLQFAFTYQPGTGNLPAINNTTNGDNLNNNLIAINIQQLYKLVIECLKSDSIASYIKSIIILPFEIPENNLAIETEETKVNTLKLGDKTITFSDTIRFMNNGSSWRIKYCSFKVPNSSSYLDFSPYKRYELYIPYYDYIELNYEEVVGCDLELYYNINVDDGTSICYIYNKTKKNIVFNTRCSLGVNFGLNTTNNEEITTKRLTETTSFAINSIVSVAGLGLGLTTGNPIQSMISLGGFASGLSRFISNYSNTFQMARASITSGVNGLQLPQLCVLKTTSTIKTNNDETKFLSLYGKPLNEIRLLNEITGFTIIDNVHIEGEDFSESTYQEKNELENLLKTGVIF